MEGCGEYQLFRIRYSDGIHIVIDELHHRQHGRNIILHIRHFDIADSAARGQLLEIRLELQLLKGVDLLGYMYMIAVRDIVLIRNALNNTEPFL